MRNYKVSVNQDFTWSVYEESSEQNIASFFFEDEARNYVRFVERGGAFSGWTPSFILQEIKVKQDINQKFEATFS